LFVPRDEQEEEAGAAGQRLTQELEEASQRKRYFAEERR
jgi:hypothetical protein